MTSTTLMTFLFQAPASTITVELVGSWDRFTNSYPLKRDKRTGPGHWRGCHTFTNITCDGDSLDVSSTSRDGGLKMGGKYWYFYRLDGDVEHHNPAEPSTNLCPFLPGQQVNVLEVPVQAIDPHLQYGPSDFVGPDVYTLDPEAKYIRPKPSVHRPSLYLSLTDVETASAAALPDEVRQSTSTAPDGQKHSSAVQQSASLRLPSLSIRKPQSSGSPTARTLLATFCKMRVTRSAGFVVGSASKSEQQDNPPNPGQSISEACYAQITKLAPADNNLHAPAADFSATNTTQSLMPCTSESHDRMRLSQVVDELPLDEQISSLCLGPPDNDAALSVATGKNSRTSNVSSYLPSLEPLREDNATFEKPSTNTRPLSSVSATIASRSILNIRQTDAVGLQVTQAASDESNLPYDEIYLGTQSCLGSDSSSYSTSNLFSPGLAPGSVYTGGMSPYHLSQPDTPSVSEFGGDFLETVLCSNSEPHVTLSNVHRPKNVCIGSTANLLDTQDPQLEGFRGNSLSENNQASALTLRKFPSATLTSREGGSPFGNQGSKDLVHSWNDGSEHRITALEELVDDLGYLGEVIV
ncbi:hypothetical protein MMC22_005661 [Lobaria immixta]|nr:hypothetical protein [Lobaria immixta]